MTTAPRVGETSLGAADIPSPAPRDDDGPLVSVVVVTAGGSDLERLLRGFERDTSYRNVEVLLVGWADTSERLDRFAGGDRLRVDVVAQHDGASFGAANNRALAVARGDYVLLLHDDVEPLHRGWLTWLTRPLIDDRSVAASGGVLVHPADGARRGRSPDRDTHQAGLDFELRAGAVTAYERDAGDPVQHALDAATPVAGLSSACLLTRTATLRSLGGLDEAASCGAEDWDLSLRLSGTGHLVVVGRTMLRHDLRGPQERHMASMANPVRRRALANFNAAWGASVRRRLLLGWLGADDPSTGGQAPTFDVSPPDSPRLERLGAELEAVGWQRKAGDVAPVVQLMEVGTPAPAVHGAGLTVAVAHAEARGDRPEGANLLVELDGRADVAGFVAEPLKGETATTGQAASAPTTEAEHLLRSLRSIAARARWAIRNCAPTRAKGTRWGDTHFAASLAAALGRRGYEARVHTVDEWEDVHAAAFDVVVHLRGLVRYRPRAGPANLLWIISHADDVTDDELDDFDLVLVASSLYAAQLRRRTVTPVEVLHQAADAHRFHPLGPAPRRSSSGIVVVANARWPVRAGPRWLMELGWDFSLYGANWTNYPEHRYVVSDYVSNDELGDIYATAAVVVTDQWDHMTREGFVANRLFDIAAAGGFAIAEHGPGVAEIFGDAIPTYSSRDELDQLLRRYLHDAADRARRSSEAMVLVRSAHTFDVRVARLVRLLDLEPAGVAR